MMSRYEIRKRNMKKMRKTAKTKVSGPWSPIVKIRLTKRELISPSNGWFALLQLGSRRRFIGEQLVSCQLTTPRKRRQRWAEQWELRTPVCVRPPSKPYASS